MLIAAAAPPVFSESCPIGHITAIFGPSGLAQLGLKPAERSRLSLELSSAFVPTIDATPCQPWNSPECSAVFKLNQQDGQSPTLEQLGCCSNQLATVLGQQLQEYFWGQRQVFELPYQAQSTPFRNAVWEQLTRIGYGQTTTYGQLAHILHKKRAARAVGQACHTNPLCLIVPCHRVIGCGGKLTGFAGGLPIKQYLLNLERFYSQASRPDTEELN